MTGDLFVPASSPDAAPVGALHTVTYVVADADAADRTLREGLGLERTDHTFARDEAERLSARFGFDGGRTLQCRLYHRTGEAANVGVRVFVVDAATPAVRPRHDGRFVGGLSIGFPMREFAATERRLAGLGIRSSIGRKDMEFTSPAGETYVSSEIHFLASEHIFLLGVRRPDGLVPVGPLPAGNPNGAAAYSARCVDNPDAVIAFLTDILGYEIRRDATLTVGERSGLRLDEGTPERFVQAFAPGSATGYLILLDHLDETIPSPSPSLGPAARGVTMWSFPVRRGFDGIRARARDAGHSVIDFPAGTASPFLPGGRSMIITDPGGFPIELFETDDTH
ncbi:MAG: hypothetical protein AAFX58_07780 [Pseudomonadota bacterium]